MSSIIRRFAANFTRTATSHTTQRTAARTTQFINRQQQFTRQPTHVRTFSSDKSRVCNVEDDAELRSLLKGNSSGLVVVDWSASWCGPCRAIAPYYEEISALPENESVTFLKADIDELPDASREAGVQAVPTFHFIKGNKIVAQLQGANMNKLNELLAQHR